MKSEQLEIQIKSLPEVAGVYQYYDKQEKIIYIGKAKNLKKRVGSYFNKNHDNRKTALLVKNIARITHIVVDTEMDALLLENNLIKKYTGERFFFYTNPGVGLIISEKNVIAGFVFFY